MSMKCISSNHYKYSQVFVCTGDTAYGIVSACVCEVPRLCVVCVCMCEVPSGDIHMYTHLPTGDNLCVCVCVC